MRVGVVLFVILLLPLAVGQETTIAPEPFEFDPCDIPEPVLFAQLGAMLENLEFDGNGSLFVTAFDAGLYRLMPNSTVEHVAASDRAPGPADASPMRLTNAFMGVTLGTDGALYVSEGHGFVTQVEGRILRFPVPGEPEFEVFAEGFPNTNGLTSDPDGNLYLAHGFRDELWKIAPDGTWDLWTRVNDVVNGVVLHPDGDRLLVAPIGDQAQHVLAIPLDDPDVREVVFRFNMGPSQYGDLVPDPSLPLMAKGIDDLGATKDGRILISGHTRLQFIAGDPVTGEACILLDDARAEPSSIRVAHGFGEWDGWAFTTDFSGDVWALDVRTDEQREAQTPTQGPPAEDDPVQSTPAATPLLFLFVFCALLGLLCREKD